MLDVNMSLVAESQTVRNLRSRAEIDRMSKKLAARIRHARKRAGLTQKELGLLVKPPVGASAVTIWESGGNVKPANLIQLPAILGVSSEWLYEGRGNIEPAVTQSPNSTAARVNIDPTLAHSELIPILGGAMGGQHGVFFNDGSPFGMVECPPSLRGVKRAYIVRQVGESMLPRFEPDELLPVHPYKTPRAGDYVVIQLAPEEPGGDMEFYSKKYVRETERDIVVEQLNPPAEIRHPKTRIMAIHKIVPWAEY